MTHSTRPLSVDEHVLVRTYVSSYDGHLGWAVTENKGTWIIRFKPFVGPRRTYCLQKTDPGRWHDASEVPHDESLTQNPRADPTKINSYFIDAFKWCQSLFPVFRWFPILGRFWLAGDIIFRFRKNPPIKTILEFLHFWYLSFCKNFTPLNSTAKNSTFSVNTTLYQCVLTRRHLWRHIYVMWIWLENWLETDPKSGSKLFSCDFRGIRSQ